jgi:hypothetical protein
MPPDLHEYHKSITSELVAVKNRIRSLVTHWQTDGEWKEAALRTVLRRHLPSSAVVGRGFVVDRDYSSTQIDLLVHRPDKPTLFSDGELAIVTPDVPGAIVEVKTRIEGPNEWTKVIKKLAQHGRRCKDLSNNSPWLGLFVYDSENPNADQILEVLCRIHKETGVAVNCVTCGYDLFIRYWPQGEYEPGDDQELDPKRQYWRAYELIHLSPSYFISNLIDAICSVDGEETGHVWYAHQDGKRPHMIREKRVEDC